MFRRLAAALAALAILAVPASAQAPRKFTVLLDWFVNPDHLPLVVAKERGMFAARGLDVELVAPADPSAPPRLVAAGQGDIALTYQPNLYLQVDEGMNLVRIGTAIATPLNTLVTLADGPIKTIADLKGKTVGFSVGGFEDALLGVMLESAGLKLSDVKLVNVNFALSPALIAGRVDAVIGAFRNFELTQLALENKKGRAFFPEEFGVPAYDELIYVARADRTKDASLSRFLDAVEEATIWTINNPDAAWATFAKAHPQLDDKLNQQAFRDTLPRFSQSPAALDARRYTRFGAFMRARGLIKDVKPLSAYVATVE